MTDKKHFALKKQSVSCYIYCNRMSSVKTSGDLITSSQLYSAAASRSLLLYIVTRKTIMAYLSLDGCRIAITSSKTLLPIDVRVSFNLVRTPLEVPTDR